MMGMGKVGDCPWSFFCRGLMCVTPVLVCIGVAFSPYIVAIVCFVLSPENNNNEDGIGKVFGKSPWRVNDSF
jgi:hypothetical protein